MRPIRTLTIPIALGASLLCVSPVLAQNAGERIAILQRENEDSLADLCRAFDAELLKALPGWSDDSLRWALFGVPTDDERQQLRSAARTLADLLGAMQPIIDNRLREADAANEDGIEEAVQLSTVLLPLARARGLLVYGVAVDPAIGTSDESRRALEEARRTAERAESVSAWSDAERGLIIAIASLRLRDTERAVGAIRSVRDAFREDRDLAETAPGTLASLRAAETLLVAIARSPVEARGSMPENPEDAERLRLRLASISASQASTADQRSRLLAAEADRLAGEALDLARERAYDDLTWLEPVFRSEALLKGASTDALGQTAKATLLIAEAARAEDPRTVLRDADVGPLMLLALALQMGQLDPDAPELIRVKHLAELGIGFDTLASGTPLGESALEWVAYLLRVCLATPDHPEIWDDATDADIAELVDALIARPGSSRSNLDLLAIPTEGDAFERAQRLLERTAQTDLTDRDAQVALAASATRLLDLLVRSQVSSLIDEPIISREKEQHAIELLNQLADPLERAEGDPGLIATMRVAGLAEPEAAFRTLQTVELDPDWIVQVLTTRAALLAGESLTGPVTDNRIFGAALFAQRDLPDGADIRASIPSAQPNFPMAGAAVDAGSVLSHRGGVYTRLAIRSLSAALRTDDADTLREVATVATDALSRIKEPADRAWLSIIGAEAALRTGNDAEAFGTFRTIVASTAPEDRSGRAYWHASMRMLEILSRQNADGSRTPAIAREIRRLRLQPSWRAHPDICQRIDAIASVVIGSD